MSFLPTRLLWLASTVAALCSLCTPPRAQEVRAGVWISAEATAVVPGLDAPALAADALPERREATLWHVTTRNADGACKVRAMARSHPHCRWIDWLAPER